MRTASLLRFLPALLALSSLACADGNGDLTRRDGGPQVPDTGPECMRNADCEDDGVFCNGTPVCTDGECVDGTPPTCDDSIACTVDSCAASTDECQNTPMDSRCPDGASCVMGTGCMVLPACEFDTDCADDGVFCNGTPVCLEASCVSPEHGPCDDGDSCTVDDCAESSEMCSSAPAEYLTDAMHCGRTGMNDCVVCPGPTALQVNTVPSCAMGSCGLACAPGFGNPDGDLANGCECASGAGTDDPDASYDDTNCDGIDGDRAHGILVSVTMGNDTASCGLELDHPCRTIAHAMTRAITESRHDLFLMAGTYDEVVVLRDGLRLFGGYDTSWVRGSRAESAHRTVIRGALDMAESQYLTVRAHDLIVAPTLENLILVGPSPSTTSGLSSYVIHVENTSGLNVIRCTLQQGNGAAGVVGSAGLDAPAVVATVDMGGDDGGNADYYISTCDNVTLGAGGRAGTNACAGGPSTLPVNAGSGGDGGTMDTVCFFVCDGVECSATAGQSGTGAGQIMTGGYGAPGTGGAGTTTCGPGTDGHGGRVQNGGAGAGASSPRGRVMGGYFVGNGGGSGSLGENGGGGGGGGGSGGCDVGFGIGDNSYGAGGGGGGAGGCAARSGGGGGGGGGGSFGVFAVSSTVTVDDCEMQRGVGGSGGAGGAGGRGQSGGPGGRGGAGAGTAVGGGVGGAGGHGGHAGGGGGGAGGPSVGVFSMSSTVTVTGAIYTGGTPGAAGVGGVSAPGAMGAEDDGVDGSAGSAGVAAETFTCAAAGAC
ncbi:MAG: hypothetical protein U0353_14875 [Sandaracinus sp.]